jgi:hypothetical protein
MIETGDVLILLPRRAGPRARKVLPVGALMYRSPQRQIFLYRGHPVTVTSTVMWKNQLFDFLALPGHLVASPDVKVVRRACCAAHLLGPGTSLCCTHHLDAQALAQWGGTWRHS